MSPDTVRPVRSVCIALAKLPLRCVWLCVWMLGHIGGLIIWCSCHNCIMHGFFFRPVHHHPRAIGAFFIRVCEYMANAFCVFVESVMQSTRITSVSKYSDYYSCLWVVVFVWVRWHCGFRQRRIRRTLCGVTVFWRFVWLKQGTWPNAFDKE